MGDIGNPITGDLISREAAIAMMEAQASAKEEVARNFRGGSNPHHTRMAEAELIRSVASGIRALPAQAPALTPQEPMAWMVTSESLGMTWFQKRKPSDHHVSQLQAMGRKVTPLYAHPPANAQKGE